MFTNTGHLAKEILFENNLNIIVGQTGSGKTELSSFLYRICVEEKVAAYFAEDKDHRRFTMENLDMITADHDVVFLNDNSLPYDLTLSQETYRNNRDIQNQLQGLCVKNNCTVFLTVSAIAEVEHITNLKGMSMPLAMSADTIITIKKLDPDKAPWLLRFLRWIFRFDIPNAEIKFLKSRHSNNKDIFYLYFDSVKEQYYDIDRRNPILRLFYDF